MAASVHRRIEMVAAATIDVTANELDAFFTAVGSQPLGGSNSVDHRARDVIDRPARHVTKSSVGPILALALIVAGLRRAEAVTRPRSTSSRNSSRPSRNWISTAEHSPQAFAGHPDMIDPPSWPTC